jgi:precorrin-6B methylase 2
VDRAQRVKARSREVLAPPYRAVRHVVFKALYERDGFNTSGFEKLDKFGLDAPDRVFHLPSPWFFLRRALKRRDVSPSDVFVDFGSGKGRIVYQAARRYPFARVVGVEIVEEFNEIARRNLELRRNKLRCQNVEFVTADAAEFEIPDDMTIAYFFSPFLHETFRTVLDNIIASIDRAPRRVLLIYAAPRMEHAIAETHRFRLLRTSKGIRRDFTHRVSIYESIPDGASQRPAAPGR